MSRHYAFLVLAAVLLCGCADASRTSLSTAPPSPPKTEADAGAIVTNLAIQRGVRLQDYEAPAVRFDTAKRVWWFHYQLKPPGMPGGHFTITVDETGKTQFIGGA
jgi:hypothetical protein